MGSYKHKTGTFKGIKETELFYQSWISDSPSAALVIIHGLGEHSGRYENIRNALKDSSISIYCFDLRGFGKSQGKRGCVDSFHDYIADIKIFVDMIKANSGFSSVLMLGHSLGGLIAASYALEYGNDLDGLALSSPAFKFTGDIPWWKKALAKVMSVVNPDFTLSSGDDYSGLSHDPEYIEDCKSDKLLHNMASARFYFEFLQYSSDCMIKAYELSVPLLIFHGNADPITDYKGSELFFERASSAKKEIKIFDGLYHKTMNEIPVEREKVLAFVTGWIKKRMSKKAAASSAAKKTASKKSAAKKSAVKKTVAKKSAVKKSAVKKTIAKKTVVKKSAVKKAAVKKTVVKKAAVKKAAAKKVKPKSSVKATKKK